MTLRRLPLPPAILFTAFLACNGEDLLLPGEGEPAGITVVQGNDQVGRVGEPLAQPVEALVTDSRGRPVTGATVVFELPEDGGAEVEPQTGHTGPDGISAFDVVLGSRIGPVEGVVRVTSSEPEPSAPVRFTAVPADAAGLTLLAGDAQAAPAGARLPDPLVVQVADVFGNPITGVAVTWDVEGGGSVSDRVVETGEDGRAAVERTLGPSTGVQRTRAAADGLAGSPVTFVHTATAGSASALEPVSGDGQSAVAGTPLPEQLVVRLLDDTGNPVPGTPVAWVVGEGGGTVAPESGPTDEEGRAATRWTLGEVVGRQTLTAVVSGVGVVGFTATATPGAPPGLRLVTQPPAAARRGVPLSRQPVVQVVDPGGAPIRESGVRVAAQVAAGGGRAAGTLDRTTGPDGRAVFTDLSLEGPPGTYTLAFSAEGYSGVTSGPIQLSRVPTSTRIESDAPDPSAPGAAVRVVFTVTSEGGRPSGSVTVSADDGSGCSAAVGAGSCSLALSEPGRRRLTARYAGTEEFAPSSDSESHQVDAPAEPPSPPEPPQGPNSTASSVAVVPAAIPVGSGRATIRVTVRDASGSALAGVRVEVSASGSGNEVTPSSETTGGNGVAEFRLRSTEPGNKTITAVAGGVTLDDRPTVTVSRAASSTRIESDEPDPSTPGEGFAVRFSVRGEGGSPGGRVTVSAGTASCEGELAADGTGDCRLSLGTSGEFTLTAAYPGDDAFAPSSDVEPHTVRSPSVQVLTIVRQPSSEALPGEPFRRQPQVQLSLEGGERVRQGGVQVRAAIGTGGGTLQGSTTAATDGGGKAEFRDLAIAGGEGTHTLVFTAEGYRSATSGPIRIARLPTTTEITRDDPDPSRPGERVEIRFRVRGDGGNPGGTVTVSAPGGAPCSAAAQAGRCTIALDQPGEVTITASYSGDARFAPSSGTERHVVAGSGPRPGDGDGDGGDDGDDGDGGDNGDDDGGDD